MNSTKQQQQKNKLSSRRPIRSSKNQIRHEGTKKDHVRLEEVISDEGKTGIQVYKSSTEKNSQQASRIHPGRCRSSRKRHNHKSVSTPKIMGLKANRKWKLEKDD